MTPLTTPTSQAGDGLVNATALDGVIRQITARINALIAALGVARGEDRQLADGSVRWRMFAQRTRDAIADMVVQVAEIRQQLDPSALNYKLTGKTIRSGTDEFGDRVFIANPYPDGKYGTTKVPFIVGGDTEARYRLRFRIRSMAQRTYAQPPWIPVRGTVSVSGNVITGVGTFFNVDIVPPTSEPAYVRVGGVVRLVATTPTPTTMTTTEAFPAPIGPGAILETNKLRQPPTSSLYETYIYRAMPAGVRPQHPFVFMADPAVPVGTPQEVAPYSTTQGRDFLDVVVKKADGSYREIGLLTFQPCVNGVYSEHEQLSASRDFIFELFVNGGDTVEFGSLNSDTYAVFYAKSDYPPDDDPRFPALYSFPAAQTGQVDLLAIEPWQDDDTLLTTEAGFPITGEAPATALRI